MASSNNFPVIELVLLRVYNTKRHPSVLVLRHCITKLDAKRAIDLVLIAKLLKQTSTGSSTPSK